MRNRFANLLPDAHGKPPPVSCSFLVKLHTLFSLNLKEPSVPPQTGASAHRHRLPPHLIIKPQSIHKDTPLIHLQPHLNQPWRSRRDILPLVTFRTAALRRLRRPFVLFLTRPLHRPLPFRRISNLLGHTSRLHARVLYCPSRSTLSVTPPQAQSSLSILLLGRGKPSCETGPTCTATPDLRYYIC